MTWIPTVENCDTYLGSRTGRYEYRAMRYRMAISNMISAGLDNDMTIVDIGAGMTEFDYCLRAEYHWRGRYIPVDGGIDGTDLNVWTPPRDVHWYVALEILEHLHEPHRLIKAMQDSATRGIVISTPNPRTTDVLGMDPTHVIEIHQSWLEDLGFEVHERTLYGGVYSNGQPDSLFGVWKATS